MNTAPDDENEAPVVHDRLVLLVDKLARNDSRIRRGDADGVHRMRVALRRIRSVLATFGPLYDDEAVAARREDLKWVAGELGGARDATVVRTRLRELATEPEELDLAAVLLEELADAEAEGMQSSVAAMDSERYSQVLRDLTDLVTDPPRTGQPETDDVLRGRVHRDWKRVRRAVLVAAETPDEVEHRAALHEVRKATKRLRYAAETLVPSYGDDAARLSRRAKRVQQALGEVQDSAVTHRALRELAGRPGRTTSEVFLLGVLQEREEAQALRAMETYDEAWRRLSKKKHRRWLR